MSNLKQNIEVSCHDGHIMHRLAWFLRNPILSNTAATILLRGAITVSRLAVLFLIAHTVDPSVFGLVIFAFAVTEIAKVIADFGIDTLAVREYAILRSSEQRDQFAGSVAVAKITCGLLVYLGLAGFYLLTQDQFQAQIGLVTGLLVGTGLWINYSIDYFQSQLDTGRVVTPSLISSALALLAVTLLLWRTADVVLSLMLLVGFELINGLLIFRTFRQHVTPQLRSVSLSFLRQLFHRCIPIISTTLIVTIYTRLDVMVISNFFDASTVGYYGLAFRFTEPFMLIATSLGISIYSRLSMLLSNRDYAHQVWPSFARYSIGLVGYGLITSTVLAVVAPLFVKLVLPQYVAAIPILQILAVALFVRTLNMGMTSAITASGHYSIITGIAGFNLIFIGTLLMFLVPRFAAPGAALALLIGEVVNSVIQLVLLQRLFWPLRMVAVAAFEGQRKPGD